ncbi:MAG: LLM class F420-dependent oxidoreductase [Actinomycetota bacterium]|nr:LLM class F420-dependent oxidoreductase [Actinomycetota bacterium]MDA2971239.1 LLM class F420-dependent oxidoreductase [Actinomycetota bacterium]MDA3001011.1 LLM class F420-dependent oxidoreductase [Actinomycetota bacterium]
MIDTAPVSGHSPDGILFGIFAPQGWKMELASIEGASAKWERTVQVARLADELGYDSLWLYDHFHNVPRPSHETVFECWTTLSALSQITRRIRLGQMVGCNSYRNPALIAKITSTLDVVSGGRLEWGIGAGWYENEYRAYGYEFPKPKDRIGMLRESVEIVRSMWTERETTFKGKYYDVVRANCDPKPLQSPRPPILIGGGGEQLTLRVVAEHADCSNFGGRIDEWTRKRDTLWQHCERIGRDPGEIRMTWSPEVFIRRSEREIEAAGSRSLWGEDVDSWRMSNLVGTPDQVADKIGSYMAAGCRGFIPWCADYPDTESLELLATEVAPRFR